jgi:2-methylcitrate dehydratase PrpD
MTESPATGGAGAAGLAAARPLHQTIADFIVRARFEDLPAAVVEKAKAQIVYQLGLALQGYYNYETELLRAALGPLDQRSPSTATSATMIGEHSRLAPSDAAFANAVMMRALFLDDLLFPGTTHAGVVTLPAALAIGEVQRASGRDLLLATVLGYEVLGKLSAAAYGWNSPQPRRPTMIYGAYGAVVATGKLLRLDAQQMAHALGFAANLCMGVPEGGQTDHYYGFFSRNGIVAAQLARVGSISYSANTLESQLGLYASFFGKVPADLPQIVATLGTDWEILRAEYKHHYGTGQNSIPVELLLDLMRTHRLQPSKVTRVRVALSHERASRAENFTRGPFKSPAEAYSSLPYALARALLQGEVVAAQYTEDEIKDPRALAAAQEVEIVFEDRPPRYYRVELVTRAGKSHSAVRLLGEKNVRDVERQVTDLEHVADVSQLMAALRPSAPRSAIAPTSNK